MITQEQVDEYIQRNFQSTAEHHAERAIRWAIEQMQAENAHLLAENDREKTMIDVARMENTLLRKALSKILEEIPANPKLPISQAIRDIAQKALEG